MQKVSTPFWGRKPEDFLFNLGPARRLFGDVIRERNAWIGHEAPNIVSLRRKRPRKLVALLCLEPVYDLSDNTNDWKTREEAAPIDSRNRKTCRTNHAAKHRENLFRKTAKVGTGGTAMTCQPSYVLIVNKAIKTKKPIKLWAFLSFFGGVDGIRTRDPRRDRPVF